MNLKKIICGSGKMLSMLTIATLGTGCTFGYASSPAFSPDSTMFAYLWQTETLAPIGPESVRMWQKVDLRWCAVDHPKRIRSLTIDTAGRESWDKKLDDYVQFSFSPDSSHVAVSTRGELFSIDLETRERKLLSAEGEIVSSFAWVADDEIGYMAYSNVRRTRDMDVADRVVWRQRVHRPLKERTAILRQDRTEVYLSYGGYSSSSESWSPLGNYLTFLPSYVGAKHQLLVVATGQISSFAPHDIRVRDIVWKPDESAVACFGNVMSQTSWPPKEALLLYEPATARTVDLTRSYESLGLGESVSVTEKLWTDDGEYLVVNDTFEGGVGAVLIRPRPWEVLQIGEHLRKRLGPLPQWHGPISAQPLGISGWVQTAAIDVVYAYNYRDDELVELGEWGNAWIGISPDGSRVARLASRGKLTISATNLEPAPPRNNGE